MKAVLNLTRLYFSVFPIQRWLPWIVVSLMILFIALLGVRTGFADLQRLAQGGAMLLALAIVLSLLPALFTAGPLFRYLSAPSSHRLLPHFRRKLLLSLGLWFLVIFSLPAAVAVFIAIIEGGVSPFVPVATIFVFISATFYFCFRLTAPSPRTVVEIVLFLVLLQFLADLEERNQVMNQVVVAAAVLMVVAWIVFIFWFLRQGRVSPVVWKWDDGQSTGRVFSFWENRLPDDIPRELAITAILRGRPSRLLTKRSGFAGGLSGLVMSGVVTTAIGYLIGAIVAHDGVAVPYPIEYAIAVGGSVGMALGVHQMASRVRLLWLLYGAARLSLFRALEREALELGVLIIVFVGLLFAGIQLAGASIGGRSALLILLLGVALSLLVIYIGIVRARNLGTIEFFGWLLAGAASFAAYYGYVSGSWPDLVAPVVLLQVFLAVLLRWLAIRRWRRVDWLDFKPYKFGLVTQD